MLTANTLRDGEVVYWRSGHWVPALADGDVFLSPGEADFALAEAAGAVRERLVVNPYLFAVRLEAGAVCPVEERERIRAAGPTVRDDLGKQACHVQIR